jgi:hypothetical protein
MNRRRKAKHALHVRCIGLSIGLVTVLALAGCSIGTDTIGLRLAKRTVFDVNWKRYERLPGSKAFALAGDPAGLNVIGLVYGLPSSDQARLRAMDYCEEEREARAIYAPCIIVAVDDVVQTGASGPFARLADSVRSGS